MEWLSAATEAVNAAVAKADAVALGQRRAEIDDVGVLGTPPSAHGYRRSTVNRPVRRPCALWSSSHGTARTTARA